MPPAGRLNDPARSGRVTARRSTMLVLIVRAISTIHGFVSYRRKRTARSNPNETGAKTDDTL